MPFAVRKLSRKATAAVAVATLIVLSIVSCSKSSSTPPPPAPPPIVRCDVTQCKTGNICADNECSLPCTHHTDCPDGYACKSANGDNDAGPVMVCRAATVPTGGGGYGTPCGANLDADCDTDNGFVCLGEKAETTATCTKINGCTADAECPANYWCGTLRERGCVSTRACTMDSDCDVAGGFQCKPSVGGAKRCIKPTNCRIAPDSCGRGFACSILKGQGSELFAHARVCLPRSYCTPCSVDADCNDPSSACIADNHGQKFCSVLCDPHGTSCDTGSECKAVNGGNYCFPHAGSCAGDGASCSRCRNDTDCGPEGYCVYNAGTTERFCAAKCASDQTCPRTPGGPPMECCTDPANCGILTNRCFPLQYPSPYPYTRYTSSCWLTKCTTNADCPTGQLCDLTKHEPVSATEERIVCGSEGVCRPGGHGRDGQSYGYDNAYGRSTGACDCAGTSYTDEAALANNRAVAFRACCVDVSLPGSSGGNVSITCPH